LINNKYLLNRTFQLWRIHNFCYNFAQICLQWNFSVWTRKSFLYVWRHTKQLYKFVIKTEWFSHMRWNYTRYFGLMSHTTNNGQSNILRLQYDTSFAIKYRVKSLCKISCCAVDHDYDTMCATNRVIFHVITLMSLRKNTRVNWKCISWPLLIQVYKSRATSVIT
jgi:hypothetical protein